MDVKQTKKMAAKKQVSRLRKPENLTLEAWQIALRKQFAAQQDFRVRNNGDDKRSPAGTDAAISTSQPALAAPAPAGATDIPRQQPAAPAQSLGDLLTAGAAFLHELGQSLRQDQPAGSGGATGALTRLIGRDETTGRNYLKLPLPQGAEPIQTLTNLLQAVLTALPPGVRS
jgi:hypothetical protein